MKLSRSFWMVTGFSVVVVAVAAYFAAEPQSGGPSVALRPTPAGISPEVAQTAIARGEDPFAELTPLDNGAGVFVASPLPEEKMNSNLVALGNGCTRWLQFVFSGHGELGKTPTLNQMTHVLYQGERDTWRLDPDNSRDMEFPARTLGVTHVVTSRITGNTQQLNLVLQLREVPEGKAVSDAVTLSGTPQQIVAALPGAATTLLQQVGVKEPRVPGSVGATSDELAFYGRLLLDQWRKMTPDYEARLEKLGQKFPIAMLPLLGDRVKLYKLAPQLLEQAGDNLGIVAYLAEVAPHQMRPYTSKWNSLLTQFPNNYQVASIKRHTGAKQGEAVRIAAENAVRASPRNPWAWIDLSAANGRVAGEVRQSRTYYQMSQQEQSTVQKFYALHQAAAERATKLDGRNGWTWRELAVAATLNGDSKTADGAFWTAQSLMPDEEHVYSWGLEMYQAKWGGDQKSLLKVAQLTAKRDAILISVSGAFAAALQTMDERDPAVQALWKRLYVVVVVGQNGWWKTQPALRAQLNAAWQAVQRQPNNVVAWSVLAKTASDAAADMRMGRYYHDLTFVERNRSGVLYCLWQFAARRVTQLQPQNGSAWLDLSKAGAFSASASIDTSAALNKALSLSPLDRDVIAWGLQMYQPKWGGHPDQLWQLAQRVGNNPALLKVLAADVVQALETIQQPTTAQSALLQKAVAQLPAMEKLTTDWKAQKRLELFWTGRRDYARARRAAEQYVKLAPNNADAHFRLGGTLHHRLSTDRKVNFEPAIKAYRRALQLNPQHAEAAFYLGRLLYWERRYTEAAHAFKQATESQPYWADALTEWGQALERADKKSEAITAYTRVLGLSYSDEDSNRNYLIARARLQSLSRPARTKVAAKKSP